MHEDFKLVLNNYSFLNPIYSNNSEFIMAQIDSRMLNSSSNALNYEYEYAYMQQAYEKHVVLNSRRFDPHYIKYEFEIDILYKMYRIFDKVKKHNVKLISSMDKMYSNLEIAQNIQFKIGQYSNIYCIQNSVIIISPAIYYYIDILSDFTHAPSKTTEQHAARCKHVGYLYGSTDVRVDYYMETDMIICLNGPIQEYMSLFFNTSNDQSDIIQYTLEITDNYLFENNVNILIDDVYYDPMENDMTRSDPSDFFNN
jgi:hypothetical protein